MSLEYLKKLGVLYWRVDGEDDPKLQAIRDVRGYSYKVRLSRYKRLLAATYLTDAGHCMCVKMDGSVLRNAVLHCAHRLRFRCRQRLPSDSW